METLLVAYGEIALKSRPVRRRLENILVKHVGSALKRAGFDGHRVLRRYGRLYVEGAPAKAAETIAKVFGVVSVMPSSKTKSDFSSVLELVVEVASERIREGQSFAVRPRVVGDHPYSSRDLAVEVGSAVLEAMSDNGVYVDLDEPDVTLYIEVRDRDAFVYTCIVNGVGGIPYGTQGRLVSLFSGGIDSPVAAWLTMKRGAEALPLLLDQRPHVGDDYIGRACKAFEAVSQYAPSGEFGLYAAPFDKVMSRILESPVPRLRCILCKRAMYRVAAAFAEEIKALGIVTGESLGQVASQTLHNLYVLDDVVELPVFRPLIGMDKVEIENIARKIGTYDVSARNVNGCTVVPNKPATRSRIVDVANLEQGLDLPGLCSEAYESIKRKL